jgi:hypothetical protein
MGAKVEVTLEAVAVAGEAVAVTLDAITIAQKLKPTSETLLQPTQQQSLSMTRRLRPLRRNPLSLMEIGKAERVGALDRGAPTDWQPQRQMR